MNKVLVVTAHPDDMEIACSGTLKKLEYSGAEIISIVTVCPSAEVNKNRSKEIVEQELYSSYYKSQFSLKVFDTDLHPNGRPNLVCDNNTMSRLNNLITDCDLAIIPNKEDWHQDHRNTHQLILPLLKNVPEIWIMHSWPYHKNYTVQPNIFVDITDYFAFKRNLLDSYGSYLSNKDIDQIALCNQFWGLQTNTQYAEAFSLLKRNVH